MKNFRFASLALLVLGLVMTGMSGCATRFGSGHFYVRAYEGNCYVVSSDTAGGSTQNVTACLELKRAMDLAAKWNVDLEQNKAVPR